MSAIPATPAGTTEGPSTFLDNPKNGAAFDAAQSAFNAIETMFGTHDHSNEQITSCLEALSNTVNDTVKKIIRHANTVQNYQDENFEEEVFQSVARKEFESAQKILELALGKLTEFNIGAATIDASKEYISASLLSKDEIDELEESFNGLNAKIFTTLREATKRLEQDLITIKLISAKIKTVKTELSDSKQTLTNAIGNFSSTDLQFKNDELLTDEGDPAQVELSLNEYITDPACFVALHLDPSSSSLAQDQEKAVELFKTHSRESEELFKEATNALRDIAVMIVKSGDDELQTFQEKANAATTTLVKVQQKARQFLSIQNDLRIEANNLRRYKSPSEAVLEKMGRTNMAARNWFVASLKDVQRLADEKNDLAEEYNPMIFHLNKIVTLIEPLQKELDTIRDDRESKEKSKADDANAASEGWTVPVLGWKVRSSTTSGSEDLSESGVLVAQENANIS